MADCSLNPLNCVEGVAKCLFTEVIWPPVKPHIDYWWRFDGNVQGLRDEIGRLERERRDMGRRMEEARLRAESATTEVKAWLTEGTLKLEEARRILQVSDDIKMWDIIRRYSVGKSAKETAEGIAKLRDDVNSIPIADPAPPASTVPVCRASTFEFQSRRGIEEDIMKSLKDGNVRMIAICGTGGVGKTTLARRIEDRVKKEKLFDEVVFVVFSQQIDMLRIQQEIAEQIRYGLSGRTVAGRAHELRTRLGDPKKKLLIFDDVWARFDPSDIGVPYGNGLGGCKVILTSRAQDACQGMEADKVIEIPVLDKIESWTLFREKSGDCVDDLALRPIAEDVAAECKGLPIALVTVGRALKNRKIETWRDALSQLRGANPTNFPEVLKDVYMPLKLSYDFLETRSEKDLFLLCCLYPEDYDIPIEDLDLFSFGLGLFERINSIEDGRNRTHHLIERLRSRFLLMTGRTDDEVKMHDVIRDVAIFIGSKEKHVVLSSLGVDMSSKDSSRNCNWLSLAVSDANAKLLERSNFPNLRLLMFLSSIDYTFRNASKGMKELITFDNFSKGMKELTVLYLSNQNLISFPQIMRFLKKLRMLHLYHCYVSDISVVGELASLEILRVWWCDQIQELPADVGKLKFLRSLELQRCWGLKRIVAGVISSLVGLEELKIVDCFIKWEAKGNLSEERNASLSELESLHNLTSLEIDSLDPNLVAEEIRLPQLLKRYHINFGRREMFGHERKYERTIKLGLWSDVTIGNWIRQLVKGTQSLTLVGYGGSTVKRLVNVFNWKFLPLEHLELRQLEELEEIIDGTIPEESPTARRQPMLEYSWNSLTYLKSMIIHRCPNLRYIFPMAVSRSLVQLERLEIQICPTIEQVFWNEMESKTCIIEFPTLKFLILQNLPNLTAFTKGVEIIKSPQLKQLEIRDCPKLQTKIGIEVSNFNGPREHLVSSRCMIENLCISNCNTIEEIFWNDTEDDGGNRHITFPKLYGLELSDLPCLTTFYRGVESIKFPKMIMLTIKNLSRMNSLLSIDSEPTHDHHCFPYFCSQKIEMVGLKELYLEDLPNEISNIWCHHVPINFFHNLEVLKIVRVNGIRNLISSSIAKTLVNLYQLCIRDCNGIVDVTANETHVLVHCVFPNLKYLNIIRNYKLRSFCQWTHAFELPSLEQVEIVDCPMMETFTIGSLTSPKLRIFRINDKKIGMHDLNDGINYFKKLRDDPVEG